ncbi:MAG: dihydropteroate synthase [Phycisphaerales bacterium]
MERPRVVAILNATPDSFFDGGQLADFDIATARAQAAVHAGAAMLDIGGESTRPGAERVEAVDQIARVVPIIEAIRSHADDRVANIPISVDTTRASVAIAAIEAGADAINDVSGGTEDPQLLGVAADAGAGLVLMHRAAPPPEDRYADEYAAEPQFDGGVVAAVRSYLRDRVRLALDAGVRRECLSIDPGLGFGKSVGQNLELLRSASDLSPEGLPVYIGASRKRFVGRLSIGASSEPSDRLAGSIAATVLGAQAGAMLHRVHDVAAHVQALSVLAAWNGRPD